jgi:bifunctional ADP-heptose synthase (sugar kinase/adenylyltransferase)
MMNFRKHVAMYLMKLAAWCVAEYGPEVAAAIENVVWAKQKNARKYIESLIAAYYDKTNIPPEDALITVAQTANGDWEIWIDPKPQDWEESELIETQ